MAAICSGVFPSPEHHLGEARPQVSVGVDVRELELAERQLAERARRLLDGGAPRDGRLDQRAQTLGVHAGPNHNT